MLYFLLSLRRPYVKTRRVSVFLQTPMNPDGWSPRHCYGVFPSSHSTLGNTFFSSPRPKDSFPYGFLISGQEGSSERFDLSRLFLLESKRIYSLLGWTCTTFLGTLKGWNLFLPFPFLSNFFIVILITPRGPRVVPLPPQKFCWTLTGALEGNSPTGAPLIFLPLFPGV